MKFSREKDDDCYQMCKIQSRLFERASKEGIPSAYFVKVFCNSPYNRMMDKNIYLSEYPSDKEVFAYMNENVHMDRGTVLPEYVMSWIGYLIREWAYTYVVRAKSILKRAPISYLAKVYGPYHTVSIQKAIQMIAEDRDININESLEEATLRVLRETMDL